MTELYPVIDYLECYKDSKKKMPGLKRQIYVITGFLGSGKTTLLNHLVNHAEMNDTAVIINEFGEVAIDHLLVKSSFEDAVVLKNGCVCCTIKGDLLDTLETLAIRQEQGTIPNFSRVVIETTGLADPAPILQTLMMEEVITARYVLSSVVTTVDGINGLNQLRDVQESVKQAAIADLILLTKTDKTAAPLIEQLLNKLSEINPSAQIIPLLKGQIDPSIIFGRSDFNPELKQIKVQDWLGRDNNTGSHTPHKHGGDISTFHITYDEPLPWRAVKVWLQSIISLRSQDVLRIKGILDLVGFDKPVVIHGVQIALHDPAVLDIWPTEERKSIIVFIGRHLVKKEIETALNKLRAHETA
jgi:G3E family GTPase